LDTEGPTAAVQLPQRLRDRAKELNEMKTP
jgi:hypothetical protein